jgi:hypothetical protein
MDSDDDGTGTDAFFLRSDELTRARKWIVYRQRRLGPEVECNSALARRERDGTLNVRAMTLAL